MISPMVVVKHGGGDSSTKSFPRYGPNRSNAFQFFRIKAFFKLECCVHCDWDSCNELRLVKKEKDIRHQQNAWLVAINQFLWILLRLELTRQGDNLMLQKPTCQCNLKPIID